MTPEELTEQTRLKGTCYGCGSKQSVLMDTGMIWGHRPRTPKYGGRRLSMMKVNVEGVPATYICGGSYKPPVELLRAFVVISRVGNE